jgi:Protein kinase domain
MGGDLMAREWDVPGYTEVKVLGSGGFGEVVLARHDASGTAVAIKYLRGEVLAHPEFAALFRAEAAVLASLDDPNVVRLYEYVESPAGAAIVMELVEGVSLRDILARHGKTTAEAALVVLQGSLLGLAAAHRRGVVHRDYKPENVLIDGAGASKLTDFGIAARAGDSPVAAGTLAYAPPEQFTGSPASPATDVYAATATFYECLTGRPPFTGDTAEVLLRQHRAAPVPLEPVPEPLRPLMAAGLAKDPGRRPADGTALVAELRAVAGRAYGPGWEDRGRSQLAAAALLLAALWPTGGPAAVQGSSVHRINLRQRIRIRHISPAKGAIAAGVAIAVVAAGTALAAGHPHRSSGHVDRSFSIAGSLTGVAATSADNAWAVGSTGSDLSPKLLIAHWNGTSWKQTPSSGLPSGELRAVAATSASNAWAVGSTNSGQSLILHWNGTSWKQVAAPTTPYALYNLAGVAAISATSAWTVGGGGPVTSEGAATAYWNGRSWTLSHGISGAIMTGVTASSATSAWAVGGTASGRTVILYWNGQMWSGTAGQLPVTAAPTSSPVPSAVSSLAPSAVSSPALPSRRHAAQALAALLAQSGTDRAAVTQAVSAVADCSPGLSQDETIFSNAASSHQALLGKLAALPDRSALPASMLQDLTTAWQASGEADQDFAKWTQDEISHGCSTNYQSDASYQATTVPDDQATKYKKAFAALWTAIANQYGLPLYQYNQI